MEVALVPVEMLDTCIDEVGPLIKRATDRSGGRWRVQDVVDSILSGEQHLWVAFDDEKIWAAITTRVSHYPRMKMLDVIMCGGERMNEWLPLLLERLDKWKIDLDCVGLETSGRIGWVKRLKPYGWKHAFAVLEKV